MGSAADFNLKVEVTKWKRFCPATGSSVCVFFYDTVGRIPLATNSLGLSLGVCVCINFPACSLPRGVCLHKMCAFASRLIITLCANLHVHSLPTFLFIFYSLISIYFL